MFDELLRWFLFLFFHLSFITLRRIGHTIKRGNRRDRTCRTNSDVVHDKPQTRRAASGDFHPTRLQLARRVDDEGLSGWSVGGRAAGGERWHRASRPSGAMMWPFTFLPTEDGSHSERPHGIPFTTTPPPNHRVVPRWKLTVLLPPHIRPFVFAVDRRHQSDPPPGQPPPLPLRGRECVAPESSECPRRHHFSYTGSIETTRVRRAITVSVSAGNAAGSNALTRSERLWVYWHILRTRDHFKFDFNLQPYLPRPVYGTFETRQ